MNFPTLNLNIPGVAFIVVEKLITICNFDFFFGYFNMDLFGEKFATPKRDTILTDYKNGQGATLRVSMETIGYSSAYISKNMDSSYLFMLATVIALFLIVCLKPVRFCSIRRPVKLVQGT